MRRIEPAPSSNPEGHHHDRLRKRLIVLALLVGGALLLMSSDALHGAVSDVVTRLEPYATTHRPAAVALFALLAAMSALLTFFSSTVIVPVAVQAWGAPVTAALLWSGWLLGGAGAYAAGRWLGRPIVRGLAGAEKLRFYQERFGRHTPFGVVLLFLSTGLA